MDISTEIFLGRNNVKYVLEGSKAAVDIPREERGRREAGVRCEIVSPGTTTNPALSPQSQLERGLSP